jgi:hypothetical protein
MTHWEIAVREERCGYDWCRIRPDEPFELLEGTHKRRVRCREHAIGTVHQAEIDAAYTAAREEQVVRERFSDRGFQSIGQVAKKLPFDAKAAALGERE